MSYPCTSCGQCCRMVMLSVNLAKEFVDAGLRDPQIEETANFPFSTKEDGSCEMLDSSNQCMVYDTRPDVCNIDKAHAKYEADKSQEEYYRSTAATCNMMISDAGLPNQFLVKY